MKGILVDVGHPAHVHYFARAVRELKAKEYKVVIAARNKDCTLDLLKAYGLSHTLRPDSKRSLLGKLLMIPRQVLFSLRLMRSENLDVALGFGSSYSAIAAYILGKKSIVFDDTDHAHLNHMLYRWAATVIYTPQNFRKNFGRRHRRFNGVMELAYTSEKPPRLRQLSSRPYVVIRLIAWNAHHDAGQTGLTDADLSEMLALVPKSCDVVFSAERGSRVSDESVIRDICPADFHSLIANAAAVISEGGTTANEASLFGVPTILINSQTSDARVPEVHKLLRSHGLQEYYSSWKSAKPAVERVLASCGLDGSAGVGKLKEFKASFINPTAVILSAIEDIGGKRGAT